MKQRIVRYLVMLMALGIFSYSSYELTLIYMESKESMDINREIDDMLYVDVVEQTTNPTDETDEGDEGITLNNSSQGPQWVWDFDLMLSVNPEIKGYIRQDDGKYIANPILQHSDNDYYLNHLANNKASSVGAIFADYRMDKGLEEKNCIVYGHNMGSRVNNSMFGSLNWYYYQTGYYKEHPTFDIYIRYKHYKYYVFAIYLTGDTDSSTYQYRFKDDEDFLNYIETCKKRSKYQFPDAGEIKATDKIMTLSTCTGDDDKRMIVQIVRREQIMDVPNAPVEEETEEETTIPIQIGGN